MAYKTLDPMNVNTPVTSTYLNQIRDNFAALLNPPVIIAHRSNETVLGSGSPVIALTSALKDSMPAWGYAAGWSVGSPTNVYLRRPGWYLAFANASFAATTQDFAFTLWRDNGSAVVLGHAQPRHYNAASGISIVRPVYSDGTHYLFLQGTGTTSGVTMLAGAEIGAIWFSE